MIYGFSFCNKEKNLPIDIVGKFWYDTPIISERGLLHAKYFPVAFAQQFSMWPNAALPDGLSGRVHGIVLPVPLVNLTPICSDTCPGADGQPRPFCAQNKKRKRYLL